jgi:hypothetical protein
MPFSNRLSGLAYRYDIDAILGEIIDGLAGKLQVRGAD